MKIVIEFGIGGHNAIIGKSFIVFNNPSQNQVVILY